MLAYEVDGSGPPLLLIHGTLGTRAVWDPVRERLARERRLILIDLPGMGDSAALPDAHVPARWIDAIAEVLDEVGAPRPAVAGHSMGGWTALELAKAGRAASVLALVPAGMWGERSSRSAVFSLRMARAMSRLTPLVVTRRAMRSETLRRFALRDQCVHPERVSLESILAATQGARSATGFREHLRAARAERFTGGEAIEVPTRVVFATRDRIARPGQSQHTDELPDHAVVEHWEDCGHLVLWDAPDRVADALLALPAA